MSKKLAGEADAEELALLQEYLFGNMEWQSAHDRLMELYTSSPAKSENALQKAEDAYLNHINRLKTQVEDFEEMQDITSYSLISAERETRRQSGKTKLFYSAVTAIIGICIIWALNTKLKGHHAEMAKSKDPQNEVRVGLGSKSKIQLPDGTQVWINSGSKLTYESSFRNNTREVYLDGEAYFDVVRDPKHPFIVHTSNIDIKVLGTAFNVKAYDLDKTIEATLIHGSIEVVNRNQPDAPRVMLKPHEKIIFKKDVIVSERGKNLETLKAPSELSKSSSILITPLPKHIADTSISETSWVYNKIAFEDEKLSDIVVKLERWYNVKIQITDEEVNDFRISGSFIDETIDEALRDLQLLIPFNYKIKNNMITISRK